MERARLVAAVWDWLPAFRAIAETEHLPSAAKRVGVTPPALSRSLKLLESAIGRPLFRRVGRRLELAPEGQLLLGGVRDAMRRVHDSLEAIEHAPGIGTVRLASVGVLKPQVAEAMGDLVAAYPDLMPELKETSTAAFEAALLDGRVDVAFVSTAVSHPSLETHVSGHASRSVWCGASHPCHGSTPDDFSDFGFVAPPRGGSGAEVDGWPHERARRVTIRVWDPSVAAHICARGDALAVLPDAMAEAFGLWRLGPAEPCAVYAVRRRRLVEGQDRADLAIDAVRAVLARR